MEDAFCSAILRGSPHDWQVPIRPNDGLDVDGFSLTLAYKLADMPELRKILIHCEQDHAEIFEAALDAHGIDHQRASDPFVGTQAAS